MNRKPHALLAVLATNKALVDRIIATASARRGSIPWPVPLRAQHVRPTQTRPKRAGRRRAVSATQATLGRMDKLAQLVIQASTRRLLEAPFVQTVRQASIPLHQQPPRRQRVMLPVLQASILCQEQLPV